MRDRQFTGIHGDALYEEIQRLLRANDLDVLYSDDMERFVRFLDEQEAFVHPKFRACHNDQTNSRFLAITKSGQNSFLGAIAFNIIETHDYTRLIKEGTAFVRDPWSHGWEGMNFTIPNQNFAGRMHFRGGLRVIENGMKLSWYLTGLHEALFSRDRAEFIVAHATPQIMEAGLPPWMYNYHHSFELPRARIPWEGRWNTLTLLWSTRDQIAQSVEAKTRLLRSRDNDELSHPVDIWKRLHKTEK